jgi:hypothetical protein
MHEYAEIASRLVVFIVCQYRLRPCSARGGVRSPMRPATKPSLWLGFARLSSRTDHHSLRASYHQSHILACALCGVLSVAMQVVILH